MIYHGKLVDVTTRVVGAEIIADSVGTAITVDDAGVFDEAGGDLTIEGSEPVAYTFADLETDTIYLATQTPVSVGDWVSIHPEREEVTALVSLDEDDDAIEARVPVGMRAIIHEGIREDPETAETVLLKWVGGSLELTEMVAVRPAMDAQFIENAGELIMENERMLGELLAENEQAIAAARQRLTDAEGLLSDAFDELNIITDEAYRNAATQQAIDAAATAQQTADDALAIAEGAVNSYYDALPPWPDNTTRPDTDLGAVWYNTDTGQVRRWNGTIWQVIEDSGVTEALEAAQKAQATADRKVATYYGSGTPVAPTGGFGAGDLWIDVTEKLRRWSGSEWVVVSDPKALADQAKADAATDATGKADQARDDAIGAAEQDATDKADQALVDAKAFATTRADGMSKTFESTVLPGTTKAPQNSVWYHVTATGATGKIKAVFVQTAAGSAGNTWRARPVTSEAIDNLDVGKLTASAATVNQAVVNKLSVQLASIIEADIGNLTVTGATNLNSLVAQRIAADTANFMKITASNVLAGDIQAAWNIVAGGRIVAGVPDGGRTELDETGLYVYRVGPNGVPYTTTSMTSSETAVNVIDQSGTVLGGLNSLGGMFGQRLSVATDATIRGTTLLGRLGGAVAPGWLDLLPRGVIGMRDYVSPDGWSAAYSSGNEYVSIIQSSRLEPGRRYRITSKIDLRSPTNSGSMRTRIRYAVDATPTTSSTELDQQTVPIPGNNVTAGYRNEGYLTVATPRRVTFRVTYQGVTGATPSRKDAQIVVEDVGPLTVDIGGDEGNDSVLYQSTWKASASRVYDKTGSALPGSDGKTDVWYWFASPTAFENVAVLFGAGAVESTDSNEFGKTLPAALNGATIHKAEIYLHNKTWYSEEEGHTTLASLASPTLPASKTIDGTLYVPPFPAGTGTWVEVPVGWFTNGANRGITIGDKDGFTLPGGPPAAPLTSGAFHGTADTDPPRARFTYSR